MKKTSFSKQYIRIILRDAYNRNLCERAKKLRGSEDIFRVYIYLEFLKLPVFL